MEKNWVVIDKKQSDVQKRIMLFGCIKKISEDVEVKDKEVVLNYTMLYNRLKKNRFFENNDFLIIEKILTRKKHK